MFFLTWLFLILMSLLNWSTLNGKSRGVIFSITVGLSQYHPPPPQTPTWPDTHSNIFTTATPRETEPFGLYLTTSGAQRLRRTPPSPCAIHQAPPEPEHRGYVWWKQELTFQTALIFDLSEMMEMHGSDGSGNFSPRSRQRNVFKTSWEHWCHSRKVKSLI